MPVTKLFSLEFVVRPGKSKHSERVIDCTTHILSSAKSVFVSVNVV